MHLSIVLVVLAVLCVSLGDATASLASSGGTFAADLYRGGAKGAKGGSRRSSIGTDSAKKGASKRSSRKAAKGKRSKASSFRTKLEKLAKQGQYVYKDVYRRAKVLRSSAFEAMLLKATWPSNDPVQPDILGEIIKYSIPAFKYSDADGEDDPYHMTLHKLWTKMSETDWRTAVKSLYILHTIARDSQPADCAKFSTAMKEMATTRNPKNPEHRYFSVDAIAELDETGAPYEGFVTAYASYVLQRNKLFTARFEELKALTANSTAKKALATLKKAQQLITLGLKAEVTDKKLTNAITGYAAKQTGNDLRDLYALMGEKIKPFVSQNGKYADQQAVGSADVLALLKFYQSAGESVRAYLGRNAKLYSRLRIKFPVDVDSKNAPSADAVAQRIRELSSSGSSAANTLSGGSSAGTSTSEDGSARVRATAHDGSQHPRSAAGAPRGGAATRRVLQRADRPLTPEEARLSVELAGSRAYAMALGGAEASAVGLAERVAASQLGGAVGKTSGGAYTNDSADDAESEDDDDYDDQDGDEEVDEEEEGDGECGGCDDDQCGVEDGPQDVKKGTRSEEGGGEGDDEQDKEDEEEEDDEEGEEEEESGAVDEAEDEDEVGADEGEEDGGEDGEGDEEGEKEDGQEDGEDDEEDDDEDADQDQEDDDK